LEALGQTDIPVNYTWRLNERHYGGLTGQNKKEAVEKFGPEQVQIWRRSFATPPPQMTAENPYYETIQTVSYLSCRTVEKKILFLQMLQISRGVLLLKLIRKMQ